MIKITSVASAATVGSSSPYTTDKRKDKRSVTINSIIKEYARTPIQEQETIITWYRTDTQATIYTSDRKMMTKLDKMYPRIKQLYDHNKIYAVEYALAPTLITFRKQKVKQNITKGERKARAKRAKYIKCVS